jgi:N-acetylmuramoyl-L-alanine amidase
MIDVRQPYQYASGVLLKSNMPAVIAETVFITNPTRQRSSPAIPADNNR